MALKNVLFYFIFFLGCFAYSSSLAQTYTYLPLNPGCDQTWTNGNCWDKVDIVGCSNNSTSNFPPIIDSDNLPGFNTAPFKNLCEVNVIINADVELNPGYDFAFYSPEYNITLGESVNLTISESLYLNPAAELYFMNATPAGEKAHVIISGDVNYNKQSSLDILDGVVLETDNIKNAFGNSYEGFAIYVAPLAELRGSGALNFTQGNSNILTVEGLFEMRQVNLDAGNPGYADSDLPTKNQLVIKGTGTSNVCSGISAIGDSYVLVEENAVLNLISLTLAGQAIFDNKSSAYLQSISISGAPYFRMFDGSETVYQTYSNSSAEAGIFKCGVEVSTPSDAVAGCGAQFVQESEEIYWEEKTGDWCFRLLPVERLYEEVRFDEVFGLVQIKWATTKEWENSHFEIERALDNNLDFEKIGTVPGAGWSDDMTYYSYKDESIPLTNKRLYYRIKQVDLDETYSYGKTMSIKIPKFELSKNAWKVYPNPTSNDMIEVALLRPSPELSGPVTFRLIHPFANHWEFTVESLNGTNQIWLNVSSGLPSGISVLEIRWGNKREYLKVMKN